MKLLALDTATEACSAALLVEGRVLSRFALAGRSHTERMVPMVRSLMSEAGVSFGQLDGYVCGIGPGSFAGVRIGLGFMKGLALVHDRPALGVSSLEMLALPALRGGASRVAAVIDARMNEVYFAGFDAGDDGLPRAVVDARVGPPRAMPELDGGIWAGVGSGWAAYEAELRAATGIGAPVDGAALPSAADALPIGLARLQRGGGVSLDRIVPRYLRDKVALTLVEQQARRAT